MYPGDYPDEIKAHNLMTDEQWRWLFTPEGLEPFCPQEGKKLDQTPFVEVWYVDSQLTKHCAVMILQMIGAEPDTRMQHRMFAQLGERWADERWLVYAVRFASMAIITKVAHDEPPPDEIAHHPRAGRARLVSGLTIDGRSASAWAEVTMGKKRRVKHVKAWECHVACDPLSDSLAVSQLHTAFAAYQRAGLRTSQPRDASRN